VAAIALRCAAVRGTMAVATGAIFIGPTAGTSPRPAARAVVTGQVATAITPGAAREAIAPASAAQAPIA
jgi:hypothetical protein